MIVAVKASDGTVISTWDDVAEVQVMPGHIPILIFIGGAISKKVIGVQALSTGMYAQYHDTKVLEH